MSEENKATVRRMWEEFFNQRDEEVADELFAADFVSHASPPGTPSGSVSMKQLIGMLTAAIPDHYTAVDDLIAEGDKVVCRATFSGTQKGNFQGIPATGKQFSQAQIHILRFAGGKVAEHWGVMDDLGMMQQLGVVPPLGQIGR